MNTPDVFPSDVFGLWAKHGNYNKLCEAADHDDARQVHALFAPPLVAYLAEYPGALVAQLEYTIKTQSAGIHNAPLLTPLTERKLERARKIRHLGYLTLVPIGVERTMEQIDVEESRRHAVTQSEEANPTAENSMESSAAADPEVNLDDHIMNSDEYHQDSDHDDDGFMADDVEYQDDHSISNEANLYMSLASTNNASSGRTLATSMTSPLDHRIVLIRECDENEENQENGDYENDDNNDQNNEVSVDYVDESDMVIDEP